MVPQVKNRYWTAVLYPENMIDDWEERIGDILQLPYVYCKHNKDHLGEYTPKKNDDDFDRIESRKEHIHCMIVHPNTTTYKHAMSIFNRLSKPGRQCLNTCESVISVRQCYEYLIHNTETAKKQGKYQYSPKDRISGNNFDIGAFEQLSALETQEIIEKISDDLIKQGFTNYTDFWVHSTKEYTLQDRIIIRNFKSHFSELCKGNYLKREDVKNVSKDEDLIDNEYTKAKGSME